MAASQASEVEVGMLFDAQVVDAPATGYEATTLVEAAAPAQALPQSWRKVDPRAPVTAALAKVILEEYATWLPRNVRARGRTPSEHTLREYAREARFFVEWLAELSLPELPDWYGGPDGVWALWMAMDRQYPRPGTPLLLVTEAVAEAYLEYLMAPGHAVYSGSRNPRAEDGGYSPATLGKKKVALDKFFEFCRKQNWMVENPLANAEIVNRLPRDRRSKVQKLRTLFPNEAEKLVAECKQEIAAGRGNPNRQARAVRDYAIICLMMGQGLRTIEIERLALESYDAERGKNGTLTVLGKGDKVRDVPLQPVPKGVLELWLKFRELYRPESDALFVNLRAGEGGPAGELGQPMSKRRVRQVVDKYLKRCGLKRAGVSCHALRHTYATGIVWKSREKGIAVDMAGIAQTMGHSDTKTTEVYVDVVDLYQNNPAQLLNDWFSMPDLGE